MERNAIEETERVAPLRIPVTPAWPRLALEGLRPQELIMLLFAVLFSTVAIVWSPLVTEWRQVVLRMIAACASIAAMNIWATFSRRGPRKWIKLFYIIPLIPVFFKTAELISFPLHGHDFDPILIAADRVLFAGANPTVWLYQNVPHPAAITEYLTVCYSLFYFLPLGLAIELYRRGQKEETDQLFFLIVYGFLLSYVCYFLIPSVGPRFTLYSFNDLSRDLPGIFFTDPIRDLLNRGENLMPGMTNSAALRAVTRDAFPSGHADITLLTMIMAFQYRARLRWPIFVLGSSLLFSTVYLRYHYVIDLIGGGVLAVVTLYTWETVRHAMIGLHRVWLTRRQQEP